MLPTVGGVTQIIELYRKGGYAGVLGARDPTTLISESVLDSAISPEGLPQANIFSPSGVFLTGATGYLGIFLLEQIIKQTDADVYCLVRASHVDEARSRLK